MIGTYLCDDVVYYSTIELEQTIFCMNESLNKEVTKWGTPITAAVEKRIRKTIDAAKAELARREKTK